MDGLSQGVMCNCYSMCNHYFTSMVYHSMTMQVPVTEVHQDVFLGAEEHRLTDFI